VHSSHHRNSTRHTQAAASRSDHQSVAWRKDRETGDVGITVAGLLIVGQMVSIQDKFPNYMLDYREHPDSKTELRWIDRLTLDGKWSGNLYDF